MPTLMVSWLAMALALTLSVGPSTIHGYQFDTIEGFIKDYKIDCSDPLECLQAVSDAQVEGDSVDLGALDLMLELATVDGCNSYSMALLKDVELGSGGLYGLEYLGQLMGSLLHRVASKCNKFLYEQFVQTNKNYIGRPSGHLNILGRNQIAKYALNPRDQPERLEVLAPGWAQLIRLLAVAAGDSAKLRLLEAAGNVETTSELLDELLIKPCKQYFGRFHNPLWDVYMVRVYATLDAGERQPADYGQLFGELPLELQDALYRNAMCQAASAGFQLDQVGAISAELAKLSL